MIHMYSGPRRCFHHRTRAFDEDPMEVTAVFIEATARPARGPGPRHAAEIAIGAFLAGYANERTRDSYRQDLTLWLRFLDRMGVNDPIHEANRSHVEVWMRQMEADGRMASTVARRVGTLTMFYQRLVDEEVLLRSPTRSVKRPSVPADSTTPWLSPRQLASWLDAAEKAGGYDAATCLILGLNALRVSELYRSNVDDIEQVKYHHVLHIMGKGQKPAVVPLPPRTMFVVSQAISGRTTGPLILNQWNGRANRDSIARTVERTCRAASVPIVRPHGIRHSAITAALEAGVPLRDVQHYARHADSRTTTRYDRARDNLDRNAAYTLSQVLAS